MEHNECPICLNRESDSSCWIPSTSNADCDRIECPSCGNFDVSKSVLASKLFRSPTSLSKVQRSVLSHYICKNSIEGRIPKLYSKLANQILQNTMLPSPAIRVQRLVRYLGDKISKSGEPLSQITDKVRAYIGAPDVRSTIDLLKELESSGIVRVNASTIDSISGPRDIDLTLEGWELYEDERRGDKGGNYGFIAMKFGDDQLDSFVKDVVKPIISREIGYELVDMRDISQAGVIDNIIREQIRGAAFVLVDLTHDNSGAYWEAGYAEGLGKPVIYLCEKSKFEKSKTHFDTNHCTTVLWFADEIENFEKQLVATVRRSL